MNSNAVDPLMRQLDELESLRAQVAQKAERIRELEGYRNLWENEYRLRIEQADQLKVAREAIECVLPWVVTQVVACNGLKCREPVCESCSSDADEAAERACAAYKTAQEALAKLDSLEVE